jgi:hypothetical protein
VSDSDSEGRAFESHQAYHQKPVFKPFFGLYWFFLSFIVQKTVFILLFLAGLKLSAPPPSDMEELREKDDPDDFTSLVYTVREDGSAMITDYSARFMGDPNSGFGIELTVPSEINGHPVTAIADGALREGSMRIFGITLPPAIKEIGNRAIYGRYLKDLKLNDGLEVIKDYAIDCGDEAIGGEALKSITMPKNLEFWAREYFFARLAKIYLSNRQT